MATASSSQSKTAVDGTPQEDCVWIELKLVRSIVQNRLSQIVLKFVDNFLWVIEKCAEWSLPRQIGEDDNQKDSGKPELVRPLPWLLFLPTLLFLRVIRMIMNAGLCILGYPKLTASGMVKSLQQCRRYLSGIMNRRKKERYESKDKRPSINEAKKALIRSIRLTLSSLSCLDASKPSSSPPPTKIHVSSILDPDPATTTSEEKSVTESDSAAKLNDSACESEEEKKNETLNEKIDRLASENSENDEDFDPDKCDSSNDSSSDEDDEESGNVSSNEVHDILIDAVTFNVNAKNDSERFLHAEQASASSPQQERIENVCGQRSSAKESRDKVEERLATSQRIDSPECHTPDRSSQEGDPTFYSPISSDSDAPKEFSVSSASITEHSKSSGETNNGAVVQKRSINVSKYHKGKRTSHGNRKKK